MNSQQAWESAIGVGEMAAYAGVENGWLPTMVVKAVGRRVGEKGGPHCIGLFDRRMVTAIPRFGQVRVSRKAVSSEKHSSRVPDHSGFPTAIRAGVEADEATDSDRGPT